MPPVVVGTPGPIDHGKTSLLRALTGIDADRLPEERERGMTIDVGYAHLDFEDGTSLDFVDVPGHDRLVGNMLVGAGEIDAALLVVAADDGPRAQTIEHLELLDALEIRDGIVVLTKIDAVEPDRVASVVDAVGVLIGGTSLAGSPVVAASAVTGQGIEALAGHLRELVRRVETRALTRPPGPRRISIDRAFEVRGRGELQLAVLIEQMRREGFELTASRPEVLLREVDGEVQEPYERITIDIPPDYIGEVQTAIAGRKGRLEQLTTDADGRVRMEFVLPVRGLIGYRGQLLTDTRGTALLHQIGEGYGPWAGEVTHRTNGVVVADRAGISNAYGLFNLEQRAELFIGAGVETYEGMIVGENSRSGDMDVNPTKEKKLTNIRTHAHDEALRLTPPRPLTLEAALEFIAEDELVEVTPLSIRLRKRQLPRHERERERGRAFERDRSVED